MPCLTTRAPAPATTSAAIVEMLTECANGLPRSHDVAAGAGTLNAVGCIPTSRRTIPSSRRPSPPCSAAPSRSQLFERGVPSPLMIWDIAQWLVDVDRRPSTSDGEHTPANRTRRRSCRWRFVVSFGVNVGQRTSGDGISRAVLARTEPAAASLWRTGQSGGCGDTVGPGPSRQPLVLWATQQSQHGGARKTSSLIVRQTPSPTGRHCLAVERWAGRCRPSHAWNTAHSVATSMYSTGGRSVAGRFPSPRWTDCAGVEASSL